MTQPINFEAAVAAYVRLRDYLKTEDDKHAERQKPHREKLEKLGDLLLNSLNATGQDNAKTKAGTAHKIEDVSVTIADKEAFRRHVIGTEAWDLLDLKANKTEVKKLVDEASEPPPGVNFSRRFKIGVRRATAGE